jgi:5-methylcytosine-specific restriction endonuclease McrA
MEQVMMGVGRVTDQELIARLRHLVRADRTLSARLLVHLGEVDARLEQLKNLLRHQVPDGDLATIVERAVDLLVDETLKQRFAQVRTPRKPCSSKLGVRRRKLKSRYIPRAVVCEVHERDGEQCTFVGSDGKRCGERGYLELHHRNPFARGGEATAANLTMLCRCHNSLLAERDFGAGFMRSKLLQAPGPSP